MSRARKPPPVAGPVRAAPGLPGRARAARRQPAGAPARPGAGEGAEAGLIARHTLTYVGSRGLAAALNLASVAAFTRLAPVESYGSYLAILSWALVLYGATCQWPKFAFFALYDEAREPVQVGTVVRILGVSLGLAAAGGGLAAAAGLVAPATAAAVVAVAFGTTLFEGAVEIARTRLKAGAVAASVLARAVLMLGLGSAALLVWGDPVHLALAVAAANALAALPAAVTTVPLMPGRGSRAEALRLLAYGWPLVLSFGLAALAQSIDRLVIERTVGPADLGAYGAVADFLRQSFVVFGEALALSLVSIAKRAARTGGMPAADAVLRDAARTLTLAAAFGCVFFLAFDERVVAVLLGPDYRAQAVALTPVLLAASILTMFRAYYFGQIIYFSGDSRLEAAASFAMLAVAGGLALALVPMLGAMGAALAYAASQAAGCLVFVLGARKAGRAGMPLPLPDMARIVGAALACGLLLAGLGALPGGRSVAGDALRLVVLVLAVGVAAWRIDAGGLAGALRRRLAA